jgi:hypothetical protein
MHLPSISIDEIFLEQLKQRFEFIVHHIKSTNENSNEINQLIKQIRADLYQRIELRNNYYHRKFSLLLHDLCLIISNKKHFQLIEKQYYHSKQFYQKIFNIQSLVNIDQYHQQYEQSKKCLYELKILVQQYENDLEQLKQKILEQNKQINVYSTNLFQIKFEQNQILSNIQQLKQRIRFEKQLHTFTLKSNEESILNNDLENQLHTEYINLCTQITEIKFNIEQKSIDLLPLQFELYIYHSILNVNDIYSMKLKDQPLLLPRITTNTEQIHQQSAIIINKIKETIVQSTLQQLPIEMISESNDKKIKSEKSNGKYILNIPLDDEMSVQLIESM